MREERVFLKYGVDGAKVRRSVRDVFAVENDFSACGHFKARNHAKSGGLAATARTEQGDEFAALYREAGVFDHLLAVVLFVDVAKFDDVVNLCFVCHCRIPFESRALIIDFLIIDFLIFSFLYL